MECFSFCVTSKESIGSKDARNETDSRKKDHDD